jgi:hypothetical protein
MRDKSGADVSPLPQGGGALHRMGETFSPDLFTGTGDFSVPAVLPPVATASNPR